MELSKQRTAGGWRMKNTDQGFAVIFVSAMLLILVSLLVSCVISLVTSNQKMINDLNDCTLAVFKYGCACVVGLLAGRRGPHGR